MDKVKFKTKLEMLDAFFVAILHVLARRGLPDNFANIFDDRIVTYEGSICTQSTAFLLCFDDSDMGAFSVLEALVFALCSIHAEALHSVAGLM